jgi:hypothetical protein
MDSSSSFVLEILTLNGLWFFLHVEANDGLPKLRRLEKLGFETYFAVVCPLLYEDAPGWHSFFVGTILVPVPVLYHIPSLDRVPDFEAVPGDAQICHLWAYCTGCHGHPEASQYDLEALRHSSGLLRQIGLSVFEEDWYRLLRRLCKFRKVSYRLWTWSGDGSPPKFNP